MESGKKNRARRDFLNALMAAAALTGMVSEPGSAQQNGRRGIERQPLSAPFTGMDAAFAQLTIQPGAAPSKPHTHSGFVLGYVIEGDYLFAINGETPRVVHAGEMFYEPPGATHTTHAAANPGQTVRLLAIVVGPRDAAILTPAQ